MKAAVFLLLVAVAVSNSAVIDSPTPRFILVTGSIVPDDKNLGPIRATYYGTSTLISSTIDWSMPNAATLRIAKIKIIDHKSSGAQAFIRSGGVGLDHARIEIIPYNNRPYDFEIEFWGSYTVKEPGVIPEAVTYERSNTVPTLTLDSEGSNSLVSSSAVGSSSPINQPTPRFFFVTGSIGPEDKNLGSTRETYYAPPGFELISSKSHFSMPNVNLRIAKIRIIDYWSSGAQSFITSGGVGSDHATILTIPHNNRPYDMEVMYWGSYTEKEPGVTPEIVTFRSSRTVPTLA